MDAKYHVVLAFLILVVSIRELRVAAAEYEYDDGIYDDEEDLPRSGRHKRDTTPMCKSNAHVCRTLMQYKDSSNADDFIVDEGVICNCDNCSLTWSEHDRYSFTWQHFKRLDMIVQYKLCGPVMPERICNDDEVAALMETEVNGWHIHMREERCRCKSNIFYLKGWEKRNNLWIYEYRCKKVICPNEGAVCAKVYVNRALGEALKYQFTCLCPDTRQCVTEVDIVPNMYTDDDEHGEYVPRMCDQIIGKGR